MFLVSLIAYTNYSQNNEFIIKKIKSSIKNIGSEEVNDIYIANSITKVTNNGKEKYYFEKKKTNDLYTILFTTDDYLYISEIKIKNNNVQFYIQDKPILRIEYNLFGSGMAEEVEVSKEQGIIKTFSLSEEAKFNIDSETISYFLNDQKKIIYNISNKDLIVEKENLLLIKNINNSLSPFITEEIENIYISENCTVFKSEGQNKFSFKENMKNGIYQVIFETDEFYYILKIKEISKSIFKVFTEIEPIKRISKNMFFDSTTENVFLDEYGRLVSSEILFTNADYNLDDDIFELSEGTYRVTFKLMHNE